MVDVCKWVQKKILAIATSKVLIALYFRHKLHNSNSTYGVLEIKSLDECKCLEEEEEHGMHYEAQPLAP